MLYKLIDGQNTFDLNPELLSIPEFAKLLTTTATVKEEDRDRRMRFVILTADRKSPLRTLPEKERREKAARIVGYPLEGNRLDKNGREAVAGKNEAIEAAIAKYREYQYDENQKALDSKNALIQSNLNYINEVNNRTETERKDKQYGKDLKLANEFGKQLPELYEAKQKLEEILNVSTENKPEITTFTSYDIPEEVMNSGENLNAIEQYMASKKQ